MMIVFSSYSMMTMMMMIMIMMIAIMSPFFHHPVVPVLPLVSGFTSNGETRSISSSAAAAIVSPSFAKQSSSSSNSISSSRSSGFRNKRSSPLLHVSSTRYPTNDISSSTSNSVVATSNNNNNNNRKVAVIVGGGPAGLAAALVLSNLKVKDEECLFGRIIVLDDTPKPLPKNNNVELSSSSSMSSSSSSSSSSYSPAKAYFYNVNKRGQTFTDTFHIDLSKRGVGVTKFAKFTVPANPNEVFDENTKPFSRDMTPTEREQMGTMYWIPRHELIQEITDTIESRNNNDNNNINGDSNIEIRYGVSCKNVEPTDNNDLVRVVIEDKDEVSSSSSSSNFIIADLCVGADGITSNVRQSLEDGKFSNSVDNNDNDPSNKNRNRNNCWTNAQNPSKQFGLRKYITPSTGLRIKGLRLKPNFTIPMGIGKGNENEGKGEEEVTSTEEENSNNNNNKQQQQDQLPLDLRYNYQLQSIATGPTDKLNLIVLPQKLETGNGLSLNICTLPDHDLWNSDKIRVDDGGRSVKEYFTKLFPRFDMNQIVDDEEWDLFASSQGAKFPPCQYSPSLYVSSPSTTEENDNNNDNNSSSSNSSGGSGDGIGAGVVLVGDALHSFPPDLGQGVNAALCDVMMLGKCFKDVLVARNNNNNNSKSDNNINDETTTTTTTTTSTKKSSSSVSVVAQALKMYETTNGPETRALIALARCGAPFQYEQSSRIMKFRKLLWTANVALRLLLNKVTKGMSPKPAILLMMDARLSFRQVMKRANTLTGILWSSVVLTFLFWMKRFVV